MNNMPITEDDGAFIEVNYANNGQTHTHIYDAFFFIGIDEKQFTAITRIPFAYNQIAVAAAQSHKKVLEKLFELTINVCAQRPDVKDALIEALKLLP